MCHPKLDCSGVSMEVSLNCTKFEENEPRENPRYMYDTYRLR